LGHFIEQTKLSLIVTGKKTGDHWQERNSEVDFFFLKGMLSLILQRAGIAEKDLHLSENPASFFAQGLCYELNSSELLQIGTLSKKILKPFEIEQDVHYAEISFDVLLKAIKLKKVKLEEIPKYPDVRRDLALLVDSGIKFDQIRHIAYTTEDKLLKEINLFDVYTGKKLGQGKKSYAVSFILQDLNKTLTDKQIDKVMERLIQAFKKNLGAQIR
jgi:phenylalanyl-tRNA synthetase beta chain